MGGRLWRGNLSISGEDRSWLQALPGAATVKPSPQSSRGCLWLVRDTYRYSCTDCTVHTQLSYCNKYFVQYRALTFRNPAITSTSSTPKAVTKTGPFLPSDLQLTEEIHGNPPYINRDHAADFGPKPLSPTPSAAKNEEHARSTGSRECKSKHHHAREFAC